MAMGAPGPVPVALARRRGAASLRYCRSSAVSVSATAASSCTFPAIRRSSSASPVRNSVPVSPPLSDRVCPASSARPSRSRSSEPRTGRPITGARRDRSSLFSVSWPSAGRAGSSGQIRPLPDSDRPMPVAVSPLSVTGPSACQASSACAVPGPDKRVSTSAISVSRADRFRSPLVAFNCPRADRLAASFSTSSRSSRVPVSSRRAFRVRVEGGRSRGVRRAMPTSSASVAASSSISKRPPSNAPSPRRLARATPASGRPVSAAKRVRSPAFSVA